MIGTRRHYPVLGIVCCLLFSAAVSAAQAQETQPDTSLVDGVFARLLTVAESVPQFQWPPTVEANDEDKINAYATAGAAESEAEKPRAKVVIMRGMLTRVIQDDTDRLAFVLGHELAHIMLGHVRTERGRERTPFLQATFTRGQEIDADRSGMELALAAGYSYRQALKGIQRMIELGLEYSSFEGLGVDHPSWKDRLVLLDEEQASLWGAMSAFDNGTIFLLVEQYFAAERCFERVTKEFPSCYEAWANLGHSRLMQYCDALDADDLRRFEVGQIVCGAFYRRPESLETQVRGIDEDLWWDAVGALRESLRLKPDLTLAKANLGIAYLLRPAGKDVGQATRYLQEAAEAAQTDDTLHPLARAAVLINAGVADLASGDLQLCAQRLDRAVQESTRAFAGQAGHVSPQSAISSALLYNRALLLAGSQRSEERREATSLLAKYLKSASPSSAWWSLGHTRYVELCREQGITPEREDELRPRREGPLRPVTSIVVDSGQLITLTDRVSEIQEQLGAAEAVPVVTGTILKRLRYPRYGIDLLVAEELLAICLVGPSAPPLPVRGAGLGTRSIALRLGMAGEELEEALGDEDYDFRQLTDPNTNYRFYRNLGLAVRLKGSSVCELVIVQIPRRSIVGSA
jgi:tetratricopeptide (TPR) repeat protein